MNRCVDRPRTTSSKQPPASRLAAASSGIDPILHLRRRLGKRCTAWITFSRRNEPSPELAAPGAPTALTGQIGMPSAARTHRRRRPEPNVLAQINRLGATRMTGPTGARGYRTSRICAFQSPYWVTQGDICAHGLIYRGTARSSSPTSWATRTTALLRVGISLARLSRAGLRPTGSTAVCCGSES